MDRSISIIILAAGLGTRMRSRKAKVLHEAGGMPLVEHVLRTALTVAPAENIAVVTGHQAEQVRERLRNYGVSFVLQPEQKGTGHAVLCCRETLEPKGGRVVVLYGDSPLLSPSTLHALIDTQQRSGDAATLITTELEDPTGYGRILRSEDGGVREIVEQKAANAEQLAIKEINSGIYCFEASHLWPALGRVQPNPASGEYYLTDVPLFLNAAGMRVGRFELKDPSEILGINTRLELSVADRILRRRKVEELMLSGVTIQSPETVLIDPLVEIDTDTIVEPFAQLLGRTKIGSDCRVGSCSILRNVKLSDGAEVLPFCHLEDAELGPEAKAGPYARMRMGAKMAAKSHVGNFVELKKTNFGAGAKAMHLAYLGDSQIGANVNVGAGTITCNYDGVNKSQTTIADGAFIGSNSTLVAPLNVGEGSYIGAGSVITKEVPADSLAIGRSHQLVKEGWAKRRREKAKNPA